MKWLDLPDAVLPAMTAFADGLGGEGTETFTEILLKDPILKENPLLITQVSPCAHLTLVCFAEEVCHICLFAPEVLFEESGK